MLRLDRATWLVRAAVRQGTPGSGAPALVRQSGDTGVYEVPVAEVTVPTGAAVIAPGQVRMRPLYQGGAIRPVRQLGDASGLLAAGDILYQGGTWYGWNGTAATPFVDDTGDVAISLNAKWREDGSCLVRRVGGTVDIEVNAIFGNILNEVIFKGDISGLVIATIPVGFRPPRNKYFAAILSGARYFRLSVQPDGKITAYWASHDLTYNTSLRASLTYVQ
ncbi:hypothetical protein ACFQHO_44805 [Actinomadura yumaensis]|uniref:hypothetical protein n=1 Tax=Actinomadura yumaensis TaxID=111807 RepID=UPI003622DEF4